MNSHHHKEPTAADDAWKSPPRGHPKRDPEMRLCLEAEFAQTPTFDGWKPWKVLSGLQDLLGDHRVELSTLVTPKILYQTDLPWRAAPHRMCLKSTLSWLTSPSAWKQLDPIQKDYWELTAHRGGGKSRHMAWKMHIWYAHGRHPSILHLEIATRHIADAQLSSLREFIKCFFEHAHQGGCYYGRGKLATAPETSHYFDVRFDDSILRSLWQESARLQKPLIPWFYPFNFLSAKHVEALRGFPALLEAWQSINGRPQIVGVDHGALIARKWISKWDLNEQDLGVTDVDSTVDEVAVWFLSVVAAKGMLAVQNTEWITAELDHIREFQKMDAARAIAPARPQRTLASWLRELARKPPRCIRDIAVPATVVRHRQPEGHPHAGTTLFEIRTRSESKPLTVYGRSLGTDAGLGSPIFAGSMRPERAVFTFDALLDGWDGENSGNADSPFPVERPRLKQFKCPRCDGRYFHLRAAFEYPDDLEELDENEQARAEDFFTWFWLLGRCAACHWDGTIADVECA